MYFYKLEAIGLDQHWKTIYCSNKEYSCEKFKAIAKEAYIETCKFVSENIDSIFNYEYMVENLIFDFSEGEDYNKSQSSAYFDKILKDKYALVNLDECLKSKLIFGTHSFPNNNTRDFYEERDRHDFVGLSHDDSKGYL